jgi:hypothetical protein
MSDDLVVTFFENQMFRNAKTNEAIPFLYTMQKELPPQLDGNCKLQNSKHV